jgi:hypothetical protein
LDNVFQAGAAASISFLASGHVSIDLTRATVVDTHAQGHDDNNPVLSDAPAAFTTMQLAQSSETSFAPKARDNLTVDPFDCPFPTDNTPDLDFQI